MRPLCLDCIYQNKHYFETIDVSSPCGTLGYPKCSGSPCKLSQCIPEPKTECPNFVSVWSNFLANNKEYIECRIAWMQRISEWSEVDYDKLKIHIHVWRDHDVDEILSEMDAREMSTLVKWAIDEDKIVKLIIQDFVDNKPDRADMKEYKKIVQQVIVDELEKLDEEDGDIDI